MTPEASSGELETPVLIVGGGCGGCAAALALLRAGVPCVMVEPTPMVGGQLSSQGVPPDEHAWIEGDGPGAPAGFQGANASYVDLRERIRTHYRAHESVTARAAADARLNPGGGWVSQLCFEPRIADAALRAMLREAGGGRSRLTLLCGLAPVAAETDGDRVRGVTFEGRGTTLVVRAELVLDASETGDVLHLAGVEHAIGAESRSVYGELHGRTDLPEGVDADPRDQQALTWCFAVEHDPEGEHVVERPASYERWRAHVPEMTPAWTGPLFSWTVPSHNEAGRATLALVPWPDQPGQGELELWRYRRIVDAGAHTDGRRDVSLMNVVQMDHWHGPLLGVSAEEADAALAGAREQSLCFLHWMQTEAPRHDTDARTGYPGLRLRADPLGSDDGFALAPYIREPRRLLARTMLTEAHVGAEQRRESGVAGFERSPLGVGEPFADSVAIGHYPIDLHPSCAGRNSVYIGACPFRVPLGALLPRRVRNVVASGKCLGVSHVANGCTRLHPVEWGVGEAAGTLAGMCVAERTEPHAVAEDVRRTCDLQARLASAGAELRWPWEADLEETRWSTR